MIRNMLAAEVAPICRRITNLPTWVRLNIDPDELARAVQSDPDRVSLVAEANGDVVGCIMFRPVAGIEFLCQRVFRSGIVFSEEQPNGFSPAQLAPGGYVNLLAVFAEHQGRGIGAALLERAEQACQHDSDRIYLCVSEENARARGFYERHGYTFVAEARDCIRTGNTEHLMVKILSQ